MSYSRWGGSRWYTFWAGQDSATENRETAFFVICPIARFTAAELRADIEQCLNTTCAEEREHGDPDIPDDDREELRGYMLEFLTDVDEKYPEPGGG